MNEYVKHKVKSCLSFAFLILLPFFYSVTSHVWVSKPWICLFLCSIKMVASETFCVDSVLCQQQPPHPPSLRGAVGIQILLRVSIQRMAIWASCSFYILSNAPVNNLVCIFSRTRSQERNCWVIGYANVRFHKINLNCSPKCSVCPCWMRK